VGVTLIGIVAVPIYTAALIWSGLPPLSALLNALAGFAALQLGFVLTGVISATWHVRRSHGKHSAAAYSIAAGPLARLFPPGGKNVIHPLQLGSARLGSSGMRLLSGGWLPLIARFRPPCHANGAPWDGIEDPGYRVPILVIGWLGYGVSITIGSPRPVAPASVPRIETAIAQYDELIALERARSAEHNTPVREASGPEATPKARRDHGDPSASVP
jgi:hypothetical protein